MDYNHLLDGIPMVGFFGAMTLIVLVSTQVGHRIGVWQRRRHPDQAEGPFGTILGAQLGLLAFVLALTLGTAMTRLDARKQAVLEGVKGVESMYFISGLVPEPHKSETRNLLRQWVEVRLEMDSLYRDPDGLKKLQDHIAQLQSLMWTHAEELAVEDHNSEIYALYASSMAEVFELHNARIVLGAQYRIPLAFWMTLIVITISSMMSVGMHYGLNSASSVAASIGMALTFGFVMLVIFDIDQPAKGWINVSNQPMYELYEKMNTIEK